MYTNNTKDGPSFAYTLVEIITKKTRVKRREPNSTFSLSQLKVVHCSASYLKYSACRFCCKSGFVQMLSNLPITNKGMAIKLNSIYIELDGQWSRSYAENSKFRFCQTISIVEVKNKSSVN